MLRSLQRSLFLSIRIWKYSDDGVCCPIHQHRTFAPDLKNTFMIFTYRNVPSWLIMTIDLMVVAFSIILSYLVRFNFMIPQQEIAPLPQIAAWILIVKWISFRLASTHTGLLRYSSTHDSGIIFAANLAAGVVFLITNGISWYFFDYFFIPSSIIVIEFFITTLVMILFRLVSKMAWIQMQGTSREKQSVVIFGAGEAGILAKNALERDTSAKSDIIAFLDDNPGKIDKKLEGINIVGTKDLEGLLASRSVDVLIIAVQNISATRKQTIIDLCLNYNTRVLTVPPVIQWINGELSFRQMKQIKIEDLLERDEIRLDENQVRRDLLDATVFITGAAGSIGSEIARQILHYPIARLVLIDNAETPLHHLELECDTLKGVPEFHIVLADIRHEGRMRRLFEQWHPTIIYHAAAYKHVPMMEHYPAESIAVNVAGTKILADLASEYKCRKFIMISSDKAVNPTNVMGASKRIAEIYTQSLDDPSGTRFITTRFGNVLGSNGSVIPLFKKQIEKGGPITVTHPDITRYFMTIPEACRLVLEAGSLGSGGEIFVFDMGNSVKIADLARKMAKLYGLEMGKDIQMVFTGLRPGEKLYEELLNNEENTLPTHNPKILIGKVRSYDRAHVAKSIDELIRLGISGDEMRIVSAMKLIVPEFISRNSRFEALDEVG